MTSIYAPTEEDARALKKIMLKDLLETMSVDTVFQILQSAEKVGEPNLNNMHKYTQKLEKELEDYKGLPLARGELEKVKTEKQNTIEQLEVLKRRTHEERVKGDQLMKENERLKLQ